MTDEISDTKPKTEFTIHEKAAELKSAAKRLNGGQAKTKLYEEYKYTNIEKQIRRLLLVTPVASAKNEYKHLNWIVLLFFVCFGVMFIMLISQSLAGQIIIGFFLLLCAIQLYNFKRYAYWGAIIYFIWFSSGLLIDYGEFGSRASPIFLSSWVTAGIVHSLLATFLLFKLFPNNPPLRGYPVNDDGDPIFET